MADQMVHEMIAAFAAGCMDKENFIQFKKYLQAGGDLPDGELGELQNIISMLPVILDLENPDPSLKDMVAKKLIAMKEDIKTQILEGKRNTFATKLRTEAFNKTGIAPQAPPQMNTLSFVEKKETPLKADSEPDEKQIPAKESPQPDNKSKEKKESSKSKTPLEDPRRLDSIPPPPILQKTKQTAEEEKPEETEKVSGVAGWIALLLTLILFTIIGYYTFSSVNSMNKEIKSLKDNVLSLQNDVAASNSFISNYSSLVEFFNYKDIAVVNMASPDAAEKASARILLSFSQKEGIVQFKNAKPLADNQAYQIWSISKGVPASLGLFTPRGSEYMKILAFPAAGKEQIESFRITVGPKEGSASPAQNVFLNGTFSDQTGKIRNY